jgi:hypothetical protein
MDIDFTIMMIMKNNREGGIQKGRKEVSSG